MGSQWLLCPTREAWSGLVSTKQYWPDPLITLITTFSKATEFAMRHQHWVPVSEAPVLTSVKNLVETAGTSGGWLENFLFKFYLLSSEWQSVIWLDRYFLCFGTLVSLHFNIKPSLFMQTSQNWNPTDGFFRALLCYGPAQMFPVSCEAACEKHILVVCTGNTSFFPRLALSVW